MDLKEQLLLIQKDKQSKTVPVGTTAFGLSGAEVCGKMVKKLEGGNSKHPHLCPVKAIIMK